MAFLIGFGLRSSLLVLYRSMQMMLFSKMRVTLNFMRVGEGVTLAESHVFI